MKELITQKRHTYLPPNPSGMKLHVAFEVGDKVRYIFDDEIKSETVQIKCGQIFTIKEVVLLNNKNVISYIVKFEGTKVGFREMEIELV